MKRIRKALFTLLLAAMYLTIWVVVNNAVTLVYCRYLEMTSVKSAGEIYSSAINNVYALNVISSILTVWIYIVIYKVRKIPFYKVVENREVPLITVIMAAICAIGSRLLVGVYSSFAQNADLLRQSIENYESSMPEILGGAQAFAAVFSAVVIAPAFEEILFRGIIMSELQKAFRPWAAILIQTLIFGAAHMVIFQSIFAVVVGTFLGILYYKTKSIRVPIACHAVFNLSVILSFENLSILAGIVLSALGIMLIAVSLFYIVNTNN